MAELFGFKFERIKDSIVKNSLPLLLMTALLMSQVVVFYGQILDTDGRERTEQDLIRRYRDICTTTRV